MSDTAIFQLAEAAGFAREYRSAFGEQKQATAEALHALLEAVGLPCTSEAQCRESHVRLAALKCGERLPPLVTATVGQPIRLPAVQRLAGRCYRIEFEPGGHVDGRFADDFGGGLELAPVDCGGYHRLLVDDSAITLAVAPPRCFGVADALGAAGAAGVAEPAPGLWALGAQLYSLRRPGDGGIGDFSGLAQLAHAAAGRGASALAISPVHAMFSADVGRFSPYGPSSRLFLNALHIDPGSVLGPDALAAAIDTLDADARSALQRLEQLPLIDWPAATTLRLRLLRRLFEMYSNREAGDELEQFRLEAGDALRDHARFEALHAWRLAHGESGDWRTWPAALCEPRAPGVAAFAAQHAEEVAFHEFLQWQAARGMRGAQQAARAAGMPIGLIADLAVGADNGGSQAWSRQDEIINGVSVGAPPDQLNARGQSWGLGAFSPHAMKAGGFHAYIEMLRATFAYAGGARIDHVLGLSRLWLVPDGASPEQGAYLHYPMEDLLRLIALESWRHRSIVIGEDLGTVPHGFDQQLAQAGLLGIRVLLFQRDGNRFLQPPEWPAKAIATTATHDLPTLAGWWAGRDIEWRSRLDLLEIGQSEAQARDARAHERREMWRALTEAGCASGDLPDSEAGVAPVDEAVRFVAATPAPLAVLPLEDALGLPEQPNLPGTVDSHPNWRRRLPGTVDTLLEQPAAARRLAILDRARPRPGG